MSVPDYLFERVTQEIRQQMDCILALTTRLASPLPAADTRACVEGVAAAAETVRRITAASTDIRAALSDALTLTPGPVALRDLVDRLDDRWRERLTGSALIKRKAGRADMNVRKCSDSGRNRQSVVRKPSSLRCGAR